MKIRIIYVALTVCMFLALAISFERRAYAYIDPGSGILACQAISAFLAGTMYFFRQQMKRLFGPRR